MSAEANGVLRNYVQFLQHSPWYFRSLSIVTIFLRDLPKMSEKQHCRTTSFACCECVWMTLYSRIPPSFIFLKHVFFFITFLYLSVFYLQFPLLMATKCRSVSAEWDETFRLQKSAIAWDESLLMFASQERGESQCKVTTVISETFVRRCMRKWN